MRNQQCIVASPRTAGTPSTVASPRTISSPRTGCRPRSNESLASPRAVASPRTGYKPRSRDASRRTPVDKRSVKGRSIASTRGQKQREQLQEKEKEKLEKTKTVADAINKLERQLMGLPDNWEGDATTYQRRNAVSVKDTVQKMMDATWKGIATKDRIGDKCVYKYEVVDVVRNQNPRTWLRYTRARDAIRSDLKARPLKPYQRIAPKTAPFARRLCDEGSFIDSSCNEVFLYHGTNPAAANAITQDDFALPKVDANARGAMLGNGIYFAECSSKSDEYAQDNLNDGLFVMLICRVTLGRPQYNIEHNPDVATMEQERANGWYNSVLGDREKIRGTYREFVLFDSEQTYPEFVVRYRRVKNVAKFPVGGN